MKYRCPDCRSFVIRFDADDYSLPRLSFCRGCGERKMFEPDKVWLRQWRADKAKKAKEVVV